MIEAVDVVSPAWRPLRKRKCGPLIQWFSCRLGRLCTFDSGLEADAAVLIEIDPTTETWCEQAVRATAVVDGDEVNSIVDFAVRSRRGEERFLEIKYESDLLAPNDRTLLQLRVQQEWARREEKNCRVVTEKEIRARPIYLANCKQLLVALRVTFPFTYVQMAGCLDEVLSRNGAVSLQYLENVCVNSGGLREHFFPALAWEIFAGRIAADLETELLNPGVKVWRHHGQLEDHPNTFKY